ncbi:Bacterial shufflon protein%2C N-terminal constant region [Achromobacter sp. 2789STDY5608633]|uniref:shufflon system plasmid conjugative transfer pilus tip adhesin PilV n=1 Tax=Pseudomonadota TaxID=1224 RepID=UPI0006C4E1EB|nr:shufflon system plasmid conjugative transfer pilus tip adhesin PilV [Achromobacter sp. 2789STDY5608633]CUJ50776.1 Bacterial shufflon protein%2C N-terminal constant region [Achromobacter sp. 2789STDY5608633]
MTFRISTTARGIPVFRRTGITQLRHAWGLLETSFVLIIAIGALAAGAQFYMDYLKNQTVRTAAEQMSFVSKAFTKYLEDEFGSVVANAGATGVYEVPLEELQPEYLSPSFYNRNPYGQEYVLAVRKPDPAKANIEGIVYTRGGDEIAPDQALMIAQSIGAAGGFTVRGGDPMKVRTTFDSFTLNLADFGADPGGTGKIVSALFLNQLGATSTDYLYRNVVPGHPELNRMNTHLGMNENNIDNAGALQAKTVTASGDIVSSGGTVKGQMLMADIGILAALGDIDAPLGAIRGARLEAASSLTVGATAVIGATLDAGGDVTSGAEVRAAGRSSGLVLHASLIAGENGSCAGYNQGDIASTTAGRLVTCQSGTWLSAMGANYERYVWWSRELVPVVSWGTTPPLPSLPAQNPTRGVYNQCVVPNPLTGSCSCHNGTGPVLVDIRQDLAEEAQAGASAFPRQITRVFECRPSFNMTG